MINVIGIRVGAPIISSGVLPAPFATAATGVTSTSFTANWNAYSGASFYLLDVSLSNTFSSFVGAYENFVVMSTSQVVSGLTSSTTYYYRVRAAVSVDSDTVSFMTRVYSGGGSLTYTETVATDDLVTNLKSFSLWSKMSVLYPMVGGSPASTAQNLKSSSFTGTFNGGWSFANTGITPNGASGYMDTGFNTNVQLVYSNSHLSFYSRTNSAASYTNTDIGNDTAPSSYFRLRLLEPTNTGWALITTVPTWANSSSVTDSLGFYLGSRTSSTKLIFQKNSTILATSTVSETTALPNNITYIGALNSNGSPTNYSIRQCAFASIGVGLTDTESSNFYACVQGFQTTLNRQIGAPWYNNGTQLLDTYSGAAAAYSLRKLRNTYVGPAIRVRRSSDNAEQDIYFDSTGGLNTSQLYGFCLGTNNGFVTTWYDQSGNGYNATQATASNQPQIVSGGSVLTLNGKPTVRFNKAANQNLYNASVSVSGAATFTLVSAITLPVTFWSYAFGIGSYSPSSGFQFSPSAYSNANDWIAGDSIFVGNGYSSSQYPRFVSAGPQYLSGVQALTLGVLSSTNAILYKDNSAMPTRISTAASVASASGLSIGTNSLGEAFPGDIQELILWGSDRTSQVSNINTAINTYYGTY